MAFRTAYCAPVEEAALGNFSVPMFACMTEEIGFEVQCDQMARLFFNI